MIGGIQREGWRIEVSRGSLFQKAIPPYASLEHDMGAVGLASRVNHISTLEGCGITITDIRG